MFRPRVIPVLLLKGETLVKSVGFKDHKYIGDPINAVRIFNDLKADELVFLDIEASKRNARIDIRFVQEVGEEANMPFSVGGGIKTLQDIRELIAAGAEKVIICSAAIDNPDFITEAANHFGSSTIVVCMDVKKKLFGGERVWKLAGTKASDFTPKEFALLMEEKGAGEIIVQSIANDGTMGGYDLNLIKSISAAVSIPVVALGGASNMDDLKKAYSEGYATGLAAGSIFVYHGTKKGVLINYPNRSNLQFEGPI